MRETSSAVRESMRKGFMNVNSGVTSEPIVYAITEK